ncbi:hypothetical protein PVAG01_06038 [Phlyctema vagabunda]|uniref:Rgp1 n=1 Tax=Phlyctema vagabunda TaxID=108571 RepID=A0ABR4PFJ5_9HELO
MSTPLSNIRVFVHWSEQTVFAGEDIECKITFKNVATTPAPSSRSSPHLGGSRKPPTPQTKNPSTLSPRPAPPSRGHRSTLSLNVPLGPGTSRARPGSGSWSGGFPKAALDNSPHQRSLSIISIGASEGAAEEARSRKDGPARLSRGHGRSASLQIVPRRGPNNSGGPPSGPLRTSTSYGSPLNSSLPSVGNGISLPARPARRPGAATAPSTPSTPGPPFARRKASPSFSKAQAFRFPAAPPSVDDQQGDQIRTQAGESYPSNVQQLLSPRSKDPIPTIISEHAAPVARILSPASITGTPRSSGEFYSLSNNSTETLASEYLPQTTGRNPLGIGSHLRKTSNLVPTNNHPAPETLMMGYAQIHGSFTLDASLISQTPFDDVKRKGAVGGQGGGVIGVESHKRDSGILRGFGWANIGESLGGLLGGGELSSIKDMRGIASSRSVPLLSTPQSILFVDLRLAPGESKSYQYSFKLPRGLPPTHRGKAIKISYKLVIGTQRPGGAREQQVKSVEIPFRVLGSVNSHGELLGHDLMTPYIILRDLARVESLDDVPSHSRSELAASRKASLLKSLPKESTLDDFMAYADELLTKQRQNSSLGLLSPTEAPRSRRPSGIEEATTAKDAIDMAILRSNIATESRQSANRFEIARSGKRVAVVMLARPAYRLGETVTVAVDFTDAEIQCYAVHAVLETSESVEPGIALRSEASILRVTRKMYVSHSESTLFARRTVFSPTIPISATPEFITSGVNLEWRVRIEFVTPRLSASTDTTGGDANTDLLEEVSRDDRGIILAAAETIECESFEISVPLRVYGALSGGGAAGAAGSESDDRSDSDGLVV